MALIPKGLVLCLGLTLLSGSLSNSYGYNLTWDGDISTTGVQDGGGNWDTTAVNRWTDGSAYQFWNSANKDTAVFGVSNGVAGVVNLTSPNIVVGGIIFNEPGSGSYTIKQSNAGNSFRLGGSSVITVNADATISASITNVDGSGFTKEGPAQLTLTDSSATYRNTYSGLVTVNAGTLLLDKHVTTVIDTAITGDLVINSNATVRLANRDQIADDATVTLYQGTLDIADQDETIGQLILNGGAILGSTGALSSSAGSDFQFFRGTVTASLAGPAGLTKNSADTVLLSGVNTYVGDTTINIGVLQLGNDLAIPAGPGKGNLVLHGTLDLNGYNPVVNGLSGSGIVTSTATNMVGLTVGSNNVGSTFYGVLNDGIGKLSLVKIGTNIFTLTANQLHSGSVTIAGGGLNLVGAASFSNSPQITVTTSATLTVTNRSDGTLTVNAGQTLRGNGTVAGNVTVGGGGLLAPGMSAGALNISGILTLASNSTTVVELDRNSGTNDSVQGLTTMAYGGTLLVTNIGGWQTGGESYQLFAATTYQGSFDNIILPALAPGLTWTNTLSVDGQIAIVGNPQQLTWDANGGIAPNPQDGAGIWNAGNTNWWDGATNVQWPNAMFASAVFGTGNGIAGMVSPELTINVGNITFNLASSGTYVIKPSGSGNKLNLIGQPTITVTNGVNASLEISLAGTGFTKAGGGKLTLAGSSADHSNSYSGPVILNAGTLELAKTNAPDGSITGELDINGGTVTYLASDQIANSAPVTINGGSLNVAAFNDMVGTVTLITGVISGTGGILSGSSFDVRNGTISGRLGGAGALVKSTAGTVTLTGTNAYTGDTSITGGILSINADAALGGTTNVIINGGALLAAANMNLSARPIRIGPVGSGTINVSGGATLTYGGIIRDNGGVGSLVKSGGGNLTLAATNTYTGTTTVNGGTLQINDGGRLGTNIATVAVNGGTLAFNRSDNLNLTCQFTGGGTVAQIAGSSLTLSGANANTANANVSVGTLKLGKSGVAACNNLTVNGGTAVITGSGGDQISGNISFNGGLLDLYGHSETINAFDANQNVVSTLANSVVSSSATLTGSYTINGGSPGEFRFDTAGGSTLTLVGLTSPFPSALNGAFHITGAGTTIWVLGVAADALNGSVTIDAGSTLQMGDGGNNGLAFGVAVVNGGTLIFNTSKANISQNAAINGAGSLIKNGTGKVTLTTGNNYAGTTTINAGTLALSGGSAINNSVAIHVAAGATLDVSAHTGATLTLASGQTLKGDGTVNGSIIAGNGSIIAPGSSISTLTFSSTLALQAGSTTIMELNKTAGTNDVVRVLTNITYGGSLNVVNLGGSQTGGESYKLFDVPSYGGTFASITLPALASGLTWTNRLAVDGTIAVLGSSSTSQPSISGVVVQGNGAVQLTFSGIAGQNYRLWGGTNLALLPVTNLWVLLTNRVFGGGLEYYIDPSATNHPQRFYIITMP